MANLKDIIAYILQNYPSNKKHELSNARVTKMVYLADWRNCLRSKGQVSDNGNVLIILALLFGMSKKRLKNSPRFLTLGPKKTCMAQPKRFFELRTIASSLTSLNPRKNRLTIS